ncbi:hypothetical protein ACWGNA_19825 [Brucella cytisi]|uniref:hypothetical protein n=1 Tax=Brucella cytisi TaxID=407152 RepID=UPI0035DC1CF1
MIPTPPTDNLYKFVTFLGAAILLFSFWTISETTQKASIGVNAATFATERVDKEISDFTDSISKREADMNTLIKQAQDAAENEQIDPNIKQNLQIELSYMIKLLAQDRDRSDRLIQKQEESQEKQDQAKILVDNSKYVFWLYTSGALLGLTCFLWGIFSWYYKHQRFQDEILQYNAKSLQTGATSTES